MTITSQARSFDKAAADYAANRPSYPPALLDAVEELAARPLKGARIADIGAGTGLATALLHARGAHVVAVEPGPGMASQFRLRLPEVPVVLGDGNHLPLASESVDFLTYAQAWHWTDPVESVPEALRVLRLGGALALWWNDSDGTVGWIADQDARLRRLFGAEDSEPDPMARFRGLPPQLDFVTRQVSWTRSVPLETHLANLASYSDFLVLGKNATETFLAAERELLTGVFPGGTVEERYVVSLAVATR
ncbi:class I SAM-dependent methyltransferase [Streptomyces sp. NBC_01264]|uniref:class I SAM-dependent methyltransferase n=1 Tax=Streptomyces sp. NBC_01264 TaxID=2903804 RepID=UPI0022596B71|nr:class I SAM-dependent methyltransferase [Streptomyces sp. NBC_01264]MCX4782524.1 methyltransferase domain-containing protein [Streptomyces sp. NBC_01264]